MAFVQIIVGSMLGGTEYVAEACEAQLHNLNHQTQLHLQPVFADITIENTLWLICTSTHGAGEYPDNIKAFVNNLEHCGYDLSTLRFMILGVGDSNYDTFCYAAKNIEKLMLSKRCIKITSLKTLDMKQDIDPEELAQQWINEINNLL